MSLPLAARGPIAAALGRGEPAYRVLGLRADNPAQRLGIDFSRAGVAVTAGKMDVHLALLAYGDGEALERVDSVPPEVDANRVVYKHAGVREWYANGPLGLEQGFDVAKPPTTGQGPLTLSLALSGNMRASLERAGVLLRGSGTALRYGGLSVSDARGRALHSWLQLAGRRLLIRVDDRGSVFPLHVDPFLQQAELTASDGAANDMFGSAVAISGNTIVVSAPGRQVGVNEQQGAVYVFAMPPGGWSNTSAPTAELTASDGGAGDRLGEYSVAVSGDTVVAGAPGHKVGANAGQGAVYVFVMPASGWAPTEHESAELVASDGAAGDDLGVAVAVSGETVVAGSGNHTVGSNADQGAAYVYVMPPGGWASAPDPMPQTAELTASDGATGDGLGYDVAVSGRTVVAGAGEHQVGSNRGQGAAYVYVEPPSGWQANETQTSELTASDGAEDDELGYGRSAVAISGNTVVAGAIGHKVGANAAQGAAYVFVEPPSGWPANDTQTAELTAPDGATGDAFGYAVAVSANIIVVGAADHTVGSNAKQGAAYVFTMPESGWVSTSNSTSELTAADGAAQDGLGDSVAISGDAVLAGAPSHQVGANAKQGAAYVFLAPSPSVSISSPVNGATYTQGQAVAASYLCNAPTGASVTLCSGPVADGAPIDTSVLGPHSFTVTTHDSDGLEASQIVTYTVVSALVTPVAPTITAARQSASRWRAGSKLAQISGTRKRKPPVGTTFSFTLNEQASVSFRFTQRVGGRKVAGKCVTQTKKNRHERACERTVTRGTLAFRGRSGANKVVFQGRISRSKKLKPGRYTLVITATNSAGAKSAPEKLSFTIVKG